MKTLMSSNYNRVEYFLLKFCTCFPLTNVYKRVFTVHFLLVRFWMAYQNKKRPGFYTLTEARYFTFLLIIHDLNKRKSLTPFCRYCYVENTCKISAKISMEVEVCQFFRMVSWKIENNRILPKFKYQILHCLISIIIK